MNKLLDLMQKESLTTNEKVELFRGMNHSESKRNNLIEAYEEAKASLEEAESNLKEAQDKMASVNNRLIVFNTEDRMLNLLEQARTEKVGQAEEGLPSEQDPHIDFAFPKHIGLGLLTKIKSLIGNNYNVFMNKNNDVIYSDGRFTILISSDRGIVLYDKEMSLARREQAHTGEVSSEFLKIAEENARFIMKAQEEFSEFTDNGWKMYYSNEEGA